MATTKTYYHVIQEQTGAFVIRPSCFPRRHQVKGSLMGLTNRPAAEIMRKDFENFHTKPSHAKTSIRNQAGKNTTGVH